MSPVSERSAWQQLQGADDDPPLRRLVHLYEKLDGSLVLRSVDRRRVLWRTRGSFDLGSFERPVLAHALSCFPELLDPICAPDLTAHGMA